MGAGSANATPGDRRRQGVDTESRSRVSITLPAMPTGKRRRKKWLPASAFVKAEFRVSADDYRARVQERDARQAADNRSPAQVWLGDPAPGRSAWDTRQATKPDQIKRPFHGPSPSTQVL